MKTNIFAFSERGSALALRISGYYENSEIHSVEKFAAPHGFTAHKSVCADMEALFREAGLLIFIGACGIAVRDIAPHIKSKTTDPAVLVLDDAGTFVIPILSGHIGGANRMARDLAARLGATPVITTATDVSGRFSVDAWAAEHGFAISSMKTAKDISAAILAGDVPVTAEKPLPAVLPVGLTAGETGALGIYIGIRTASPFAETLHLIPRCVTLGIGCRRAVTAQAVRDAVTAALAVAGIDRRAVCGVASIDVKRDEAGLLAFCEEWKLAPAFYSAETLAAVTGTFSDSEFVERTVGVGNVCERAAMMGGGTLILSKYAENGVTVAASVSDWRLSFA